MLAAPTLRATPIRLLAWVLAVAPAIAQGGDARPAPELTPEGAASVLQRTPFDARAGARLDALARRLGVDGVPTGSGVRISQVEASDEGGYAADPRQLEVTTARIFLRSGPTAASYHATQVGRVLTDVAGGLEAIDAFDALGWLSGGFLNGSGPVPPSRAPAKIINNSWVGQAGKASNAYLRKVDYAVVEQDLLVVSGVNNGVGSLDVPLVACHFNGIAVGRTDGQHRSGGTRGGIDGAGRMKPELVAPAPATSLATPLVSAAGALMAETAARAPRIANPQRAASPLVLKAVLLAGATHAPEWSNAAPPSGSARGATSTPLDAVFGAGELNVERSHWILAAGEGAATSGPGTAKVDPSGWSLVELPRDASRWLPVRVEATKPFASIVACWNRRVADDFRSYAMPDVDLELWRAGEDGTPQRLVGERGRAAFESGNVLSDSLVDNVEHLYVRDLQRGLYWIEVRRKSDRHAGPWTVAVAWDFPCPSPVAYGEGSPGRDGRVPALGLRGLPAKFVNDFRLVVENAPANARAIVLAGPARSDVAPFLVGPEVRRVAEFRTDEQGRGGYRLELLSEWVGSQHHFQVVFPEHPRHLATTNALEVVYAP